MGTLLDAISKETGEVTFPISTGSYGKAHPRN